MTLYLLIIVLFTQLIVTLSVDLCSYSRVDSIAYISDKKQYFITSCGYYWIVKENEMTPKNSGKAMPGGWYGDGAAYINTMQCKGSQEQYILVVNKNVYKLFDIRSNSWLNGGSVQSFQKISHIRLNWAERMNAIFDFSTYEIYGVQNGKYAGSHWKAICNGSNTFTEDYDPHDARIDFETRNKIDAMMVGPNNGLYVFTGKDYYILPLDMSRSVKGKILRQSKSSIKSVRRDFFKCTGGSGSFECNRGISKSMWLIIGIVLLIIVVGVIAFLVFLYMRKRKASATTKVKAGSAPKTTTTGTTGTTLFNKDNKAVPKTKAEKSKRSKING